MKMPKFIKLTASAYTINNGLFINFNKVIYMSELSNGKTQLHFSTRNTLSVNENWYQIAKLLERLE